MAVARPLVTVEGQERPLYICDICPVRQQAQERPHTLKARMWRFHTKFCPMWNSYQRAINPEATKKRPRMKRLLRLVVLGAIVYGVVRALMGRE